MGIFPINISETEQPSKIKATEFPLLVVESVNSKPVKHSVIAENEEVQHFVENCLKARGKWQDDETLEEVKDVLVFVRLFCCLFLFVPFISS